MKITHHNPPTMHISPAFSQAVSVEGLIKIDAMAAWRILMAHNTPVGKTRTQGWEVGVSRTFDMDADTAWGLLMSDAGLRLWFGHGDTLRVEKDATFMTEEGVTGRVVSFLPNRMVRMRWRPANWEVASTLQVRATPAGTKTKVSFHQEQMQGEIEREQMRQHWQQVIAALEALSVGDSAV